MTVSRSQPKTEKQLLFLQIEKLRDRIEELEAELAITRKCNERVDCLCRGEVMELKK